ncbi:30S ribosomal protein S17 [Candidatus Pacearchaeota archaeon]|nr:30S ribosomal protein S17 [Candidatus Pacearchaeota archaeon]
MKQEKNETIVESNKNSCNDSQCNIHSGLKVRGRTFDGYVTKKFNRRVVIEFEKIVYIKKYERYTKRKTKLHARVPSCVQEKVKVGDYVKVGECRPLSKIIHFVFLEKIRDADKKNNEGDLK